MSIFQWRLEQNARRPLFAMVDVRSVSPVLMSGTHFLSIPSSHLVAVFKRSLKTFLLQQISHLIITYAGKAFTGVYSRGYCFFLFCAVFVWTRVQIAVATLSGNSLRQTVYTHCASVHQASKLIAALLRVAGVTAGLAKSNGSLPPGLWLTSPAGWLPRTEISSGTLRSVIEYGRPFLQF